MKMNKPEKEDAAKSANQGRAKKRKMTSPEKVKPVAIVTHKLEWRDQFFAFEVQPSQGNLNWRFLMPYLILNNSFPEEDRLECELLREPYQWTEAEKALIAKNVVDTAKKSFAIS